MFVQTYLDTDMTILKPRRNNQGFTLIAVIILIVVTAITVLAVTTFLVQGLDLLDVRIIMAKCIYCARGGIQSAIYNFRNNDRSGPGYFSLGRYNIDTQNYFVLGATAADLLMVNNSGSDFYPVGNRSNQGRNLNGLRIQNATNSNTITIDRMIITWNNSNRLQRIRIGQSTLWQGNAASPADANLNPNFTLDTVPTNYPIDEIRFSANMRGSTVTVEFVMTDGTRKSVVVYSPGARNDFNFVVKSTGYVTNANIYRTIQAEYNALTTRIVNYYEINSQISP